MYLCIFLPANVWNQHQPGRSCVTVLGNCRSTGSKCNRLKEDQKSTQQVLRDNWLFDERIEKWKDLRIIAVEVVAEVLSRHGTAFVLPANDTAPRSVLHHQQKPTINTIVSFRLSAIYNYWSQWKEKRQKEN